MRRFFRRDLALIDRPRLTAVRTNRQFVVLGQTVVVSWIAEQARTIEVATTSRKVRVDGRPGHGSVPVLLNESGFIEVRAVSKAGIDHRCLGPIAVVRAPIEEPLPVPMPRPEWPSLTASPPVALPPLPAVELPAVPFVPALSAAEPEAGSAPRWPTLPSARCPVDILSLIVHGPRLDLGVEPDGGGT